MPADPRKTVLCRYYYDPLDRLIDCSPSVEAGIHRFYCVSRLATEIQGAMQRSVFQHDDQVLAQLWRDNVKADTMLLATDQQRSVLNALNATRPHPLVYTPYGHHSMQSGLPGLLGFNGERPDPVTGHYLLGNGYRAFNPVLMRFNSPDNLSPFGEGGLNAYAYCGGDPRNRADPSGHAPGIVNFFRRLLRRKPLVPKSKAPNPNPALPLAARNATGTPPLPPRNAVEPPPPLPPRKAPERPPPLPPRNAPNHSPRGPSVTPEPSSPAGYFKVNKNVFIELPGKPDHVFGAEWPLRPDDIRRLEEYGVKIPKELLNQSSKTGVTNLGFVPDGVSTIRQGA